MAFFFQSLSIFFVSAHEYQPHLNVYSYPSPLFQSLPTGLNVDHDLPRSSLLLASTETCVAGVHFFFLRHLSELSLSDRIPEHLFPPCQPMIFLSQYPHYSPMLVLRNATQYCTCHWLRSIFIRRSNCGIWRERLFIFSATSYF